MPKRPSSQAQLFSEPKKLCFLFRSHFLIIQIKLLIDPKLKLQRPYMPTQLNFSRPIHSFLNQLNFSQFSITYSKIKIEGFQSWSAIDSPYSQFLIHLQFTKKNSLLFGYTSESTGNNPFSLIAFSNILWICALSFYLWPTVSVHV